MTSATIILTVFLAAGCVFSPRRFFPLPFVLAACLVPMNQRLYFGDLDFTVLRILVLTGMLRILLRSEVKNICWNNFDKLVLAWSISKTLIYTIQMGSMGAFLNRCGVMYDSLGIYWIFRQFFRSFDDIVHVVKMFAICAIISTPFVAAEKVFQFSIFSFFGPIGAGFHRGRFRCAGSFPHYIMLGCFWASMIPIFYSSWKAKIDPKISILGVLCALCLVYFSASSTPILTIVAILLLWRCYNYRELGKILFLVFCGMLIFLHIVMEAPVWHLMARVNVFGGSTGWHRYHLFDQFIAHTSEWFILGTKSTSEWGLGLGDVTNQYVLEAVRGGALTLCIFVVMMYKAVKISGQSSLILVDQSNRWIAWGICILLLSHIVSFWGVSYFGQILLLLYITLAMTGYLKEHNIEKTTTSQMINKGYD